MAKIEPIRYRPSRPETVSGNVEWVERQGVHACLLPMIFWEEGKPWREANLWFKEQVTDESCDLKTVNCKAYALLTYATWLETNNVSWLHFPESKDERCLNRYRGALIKYRSTNKLAPSTTTNKMRVVIQFYRWLLEKGIIPNENSLWVDRSITIHFNTARGISLSKNVRSSSLAIPCRRINKANPEDGLWPLTPEDRELVLDCAEANCPIEIYLMLLLGFHTGLRIESITDLRVETLQRAIPHPMSTGYSILHLGPGASPPVRTKFDVTGQVDIPTRLLDMLKDYLNSIERKRRGEKAHITIKNVVFLTTHGNEYARRDLNKSPAINVAIHKLRKIGIEKGLEALNRFKFHQTRATFATELILHAIEHDPENCLRIVRDKFLQKDEKSALAYIKFVKREHSEISAKAADKFTKAFLGRFYEN